MPAKAQARFCAYRFFVMAQSTARRLEPGLKSFFQESLSVLGIHSRAIAARYPAVQCIICSAGNFFS